MNKIVRGIIILFIGLSVIKGLYVLINSRFFKYIRRGYVFDVYVIYL